MTAVQFVHLHVHSDYSPMRGVSSLEELCALARGQGSPAMALTDTNGLYGAIRFVEHAKQLGLRPILGAELTGADHRAVLLAKTPDGYANLCRVLSERHCNPSFDVLASVSRYRDGLIVLTDDEAALMAWAKDARQDLYVELTPGPALHDALLLSRRINLPPVATNRVYFSQANDFATHRLLRTIALNTTLSRLPKEACCSPSQWLVPPARMASQFPHVPEALENTIRIAEACHSDWRFGEAIFPAFRRLTDEEAFLTLKDKTYAGALNRYGAISQEVRDRIEKELAIIREKRFAHYFLVVEEIVTALKRTTCGRGSVAASIVSYCLNITHVDPIKHHLFFERFLNPGRKDPPDIDIDFAWDERDDILRWVFEQYGERQAAMVANHNSLDFRAAIREVAKVYGMPAEEISRMSSLVVRQKDLLGFSTPPTNEQWLSRLSHILRLKAPWPEILAQALKAQNHFRHLSMHCGGVVIVPDEIRRYVPVQYTAKGLPVIQWEKDQTEDAGLVKIDILGNRSLAVIRNALAAIAKHTGWTIDYETWDPLNDTATQNTIRCGDTIGCFYIESPATRLLLRKLWIGMPPHRRAEANVFDYLVMVSSLVRPATNPFVEDFIRMAQKDSCVHWHDKLEDILKETHGIMTYQEDVSKVAMELADFSIDDADQLRKVLSKKHKAKQLQDYRIQFFNGAKKNGASREIIDQLWQMIMSFAGYSFCKPHSASYAQVSFKSAYLRTHYPAEFIAAVISNEGGFYSTFAYISEARRMGLAILLPDINESDWAYRGEGERLRMGLMQVKTIPEALGVRIVEERTQHGPYRSFQDFLRRVKPESSHARALVRAGCCDSIAGELTRPALMWRLYVGSDVASSPLPIPNDYSAAQKRAHEIESFGFLASRHPLTLYRKQIERLRPVPASQMHCYVGRRIIMVGVLITEKTAETKHGQAMEFITLEDMTALYDATLFPEVYRRCCHLLSPNRPYVVRGSVEETFGVVTLTALDLQVLEPTMDEGNHSLPNWQESRYGKLCVAPSDPPLNSFPPA
ncbi:MAG: DNA polymerase III subunit alpha [Nitrospira sp.]|jgi:error-prone DNA polymerase|nr:MAG: DNA polymerase III subunit alpha [Nitrospira sp.]